MSQHSSIEDFDLLGRLGSGSFGTVYKARRHADDMIYVIKVVRIVELSLKEQQDAINEVTILSQLESPYVVRYFDSFISGDSLHLVMEYCNKGDLQRLIKKMKDKELVGLEERVTWNISLQVILGLHYLHCKKVLHRDLKSANVFLTMEAGRGNERYTVKIGDLGVAKLLETSTAFAQTIVGTPYYLSPELCADEPYRDKSDCWALGVLLYECCTLRHPFEARNQCALIMKIMQSPVEPPTQEHASHELIELIMWLLQKDPQNRPSVKEILTEEFIMKKLEQYGLPLPPEFDRVIPTHRLHPPENDTIERLNATISRTIDAAPSGGHGSGPSAAGGKEGRTVSISTYEMDSKVAAMESHEPRNMMPPPPPKKTPQKRFTTAMKTNNSAAQSQNSHAGPSPSIAVRRGANGGLNANQNAVAAPTAMGTANNGGDVAFGGVVGVSLGNVGGGGGNSSISGIGSGSHLNAAGGASRVGSGAGVAGPIGNKAPRLHTTTATGTNANVAELRGNRVRGPAGANKDLVSQKARQRHQKRQGVRAGRGTGIHVSRSASAVDDVANGAKRSPTNEPITYAAAATIADAKVDDIGPGMGEDDDDMKETISRYHGNNYTLRRNFDRVNSSSDAKLESTIMSARAASKKDLYDDDNHQTGAARVGVDSKGSPISYRRNEPEAYESAEDRVYRNMLEDAMMNHQYDYDDEEGEYSEDDDNDDIEGGDDGEEYDSHYGRYHDDGTDLDTYDEGYVEGEADYSADSLGVRHSDNRESSTYNYGHGEVGVVREIVRTNAPDVDASGSIYSPNRGGDQKNRNHHRMSTEDSAEQYEEDFEQFDDPIEQEAATLQRLRRPSRQMQPLLDVDHMCDREYTTQDGTLRKSLSVTNKLMAEAAQLSETFARAKAAGGAAAGDHRHIGEGHDFDDDDDAWDVLWTEQRGKVRSTNTTSSAAAVSDRNKSNRDNAAVDDSQPRQPRRGSSSDFSDVIRSKADEYRRHLSKCLGPDLFGRLYDLCAAYMYTTDATALATLNMQQMELLTELTDQLSGEEMTTREAIQHVKGLLAMEMGDPRIHITDQYYK